MERLCIRGMDQDLKWAAAIWVPMDTPSLDMSGHTAGRPNRWLPLTGSRDRLRPPDEVMLIIIPNRAYHEPNNWDGAWHWVYNISRKPIFYLEWMCEHWGDCLSQERGIVTSLKNWRVFALKSWNTLSRLKSLWGWPLAHYTYIYIGIYIYGFPVSDYSDSSVLHHLSLVAWGGNLQHVESAFIIFATSMIF